MATIRGVSRTARSLPSFSSFSSSQLCQYTSRRVASTQAAGASPEQIPDLLDLEPNSSALSGLPGPELKEVYRPWKNSKDRKFRLPSSRYQYHPPKYNRGPLHPVQSPLSSDPIARDFVPGPFNYPRLKQTYRSTIAEDIMLMAYNHTPPGTPKPEPKADRLRSWEGDSPYFENRARRGPRGSAALNIIERDITFRNIPEIHSITVQSFQPKGQENPDYLLVARAVIMSITGELPMMTKVKKSVVHWSSVAGKKSGVKATIYGNAAYEFLDRCVNLVFPRIKDWKGIESTTGDSSGNLAWGFTAEQVAMFPEVQCNYDMYPGRMIPGCHVYVKTTATSDRQARLLLQAHGIPFYGEIRN